MIKAVKCPYCRTSNKLPEFRSEGCPQCLPYGRMPYMQTKWSRIGDDFYSVIGWDKFGPGILRLPKGQKAFYTVAICKSCEKPFDVYWSATKSPAQRLWPYLFEGYEPKQNLLSRLAFRLLPSRGSNLGVAVAAFTIMLLFYSLPEIFSHGPIWSRGILAIIRALPISVLVFSYLQIIDSLGGITHRLEFR